MIFTVRYPHVRNLVKHYAQKLSDNVILKILDHGVKSENNAEHLSYFIWKMLDEMEKDREEGSIVLGGIDNTSMGPDISYEMNALMEQSGYIYIWEKISDEA